MPEEVKSCFAYFSIVLIIDEKLLKPSEFPALLWMMQNIIASNKIDYFYI